LAHNSESKTTATIQEKCKQRFPFQITCTDTDNRAKNKKDFNNYLEKKKIVHFYSRFKTLTDNPRIEYSHLTNKVKFYRHDNI
jgi:hypothetical protein